MSDGTATSIRGRFSVPNRLFIGLALLPLLALCFKVWHYGLAFPYWDAWHFALFLQKAAGEGVGFADFWAQHNEHRSVVPRLVMYALASLSGWDVGWELAANLFLGVAIFLMLCWLAFQLGTTDSRPWWLVPVFSFLVFSWVQMENWVWGWEIHVFLNVAAVVAGTLALTGGPLSPARFMFAVCAGVIASFSFANGLLYWIALAPLVVLAPGLAREARMLYSLLWIAVGVLVIQLYLLDYTKPGVSPSIGAMLQAPGAFFGYYLVFLGAPVTGIFTQPAWHGAGPPVGTAHFVAGALGLLALPGLAWVLLRRDIRRYPALLPWAGLALYVLGSAALTAAGRAGFGLEQAMTSRYTTITTLYWCALAALVAIYIQERPLRALECPHRRRVYGAIAALLFCAVLFLSHHSQRAWEQNTRWKQMGWTALRAGHLAPLYLQDLCWDPVELRDRFLPILEEGHWAGFGEVPYKPVEKADDYVDEAEKFVAMGLYGQAKTYLETALILDESNARARERYEELRLLVERANGE